ncbi:hypothetical protein AVEN_168220-1 [Araneus ventricosus]|uniref:Uncharacterized protein n=1 Tax=Araneus ventricosus TaxID=182803 RepID=A0A4Y2IUT0_ARAVE|nr:hypothetical protein AVEN_266568-1 [Araneus ventricosus]GBM81405.1 hypothetical protein AVEN_168220-1 [Araneus ventricosus]
MGISTAAGKSRISNQPNSGSSCTESLVGTFARIVGTSNDLTKSKPCYEGSKSRIRGVGEGKGGGKRRADVEEERGSLSSTASAI